MPYGVGLIGALEWVFVWFTCGFRCIGCDLRCGGFRVTIECALGREFTTWVEVVVWAVLGCWFVMLV